MKSFLTFIFFSVGTQLLLARPAERTAADTLVMVQLLFRHGDVTPEDIYPTDPNNGNWPEGFGQLTNLGKQQHYELGQFVRNRYGDFLNSTYYYENVKAETSDYDRCLMSVLCQMAAVYPPNPADNWNPNIAWQPLPVHTMPVEEDYWLGHDAPCPNYDDLLDEQKSSDEMRDLDDQYASLYELLTTETGEEISSIFDVADIYDTTYCELCHNMTIPSWITSDLYEQMRECKNLKYIWKSKTPDMVRLSGGATIGLLVSNMKDKQNGDLPGLQIVFLSTHETEMAAVQIGMDVYNGIDPPYASCLFVELHNQDGNFVVQMFYRNDTTQPLQELTLPGCSSPCPYEMFHDLTDGVTPGDDIADECGA